MTARVRSACVGGVLHVVLDAPQRRNALTREMLRALAALVAGVDESVTALVISGAEGAFSAGADFGELTGTSADISYDDDVAAVGEALVRCPRVVVAAVEGPCIGAAVDLALACDVRIAGRGSYLQVPAVRLGLLYNPEAIARWSARLPQDVLRRMLLLGERFDDAEALRVGLVSQVVERGEAVTRAVDLLSAITTEERVALAATKQVLSALERPGFDPRPWADPRRHLLDSPARAAAVRRAKHRHGRSEDDHDGGRR